MSAKDDATIRVGVEADNKNYNKKIKESEQQTKKSTSKMEKALKSVRNTFNKMGQIGSGAAKGLVAGLAGVGAAVAGVVASTEEFRNSQALLEVAFADAGFSAETASKAYGDMYRVLGDTGQATEAAQHMAALADNQEQLNDLTRAAQGVYAAYGESLPIESLMEAANETAKCGAVTGAFADALNWSSASADEWVNALSGNQAALEAFQVASYNGATAEDAFNAALAACSTEQERQQLITDVLNGLYGDMGDELAEANAEVWAQRDAQVALDTALSDLGEALSPVVTAFTTLAADVLKDVTPYIKNLAEKYAPTLAEKLGGVGEAIGVIITWIADNWSLIGKVVKVLAAIVTIMALFSVVMGIIGIVTSPVALIVLAVVVAAVLLALAGKWIVDNWDKIKETVGGAMDAVYEKTKPVRSWLYTNVSKPFLDTFDLTAEDYANNTEGVIGAAKITWSGMVSWWDTNVAQMLAKKFGGTAEDYKFSLENMYTIIKTMTKLMTESFYNNYVVPFKQKITDIKDAFREKFQQAKESVETALGNIKTWFTDNVYTPVVNKVNSIKESFSTKFQQAKEAVIGAFTNVKTWFSNNVFTPISNFIENIKTRFNTIKTTVGNVIQGVREFFSFDWQLPSLKLPHINYDIITVPVLGEIPNPLTLSVSWYAKGGVFDKPTLMSGIGEAGAEAVVPLENNLGWLDKLAGMLEERLGSGSTPIVLQVDGKTFAQTAVTSMNALTRQQGRLGLNLV